MSTSPILQLAAERRRRAWRNHGLLFGGAIAAGLAIGATPTIWAERSDAGVQTAPAAIEAPPQASEVPSFAAFERPPVALQASASEARADAGPRSVAFGFCHEGGGTNCVVDGDTIWLNGQKIRIADIDTPETHDFRCPEEKSLGDQATQRLHQLVNAGEVTLQTIDRDEDRYGRKLRLVFVDGRNVGDTLVAEGLARPYAGGRKPWC